MKLPHVLLAFLFVGATTVFAQEKEITLEEIWNGTFSPERLESLKSLNNGTEYIVLNQDQNSGTSIDVYDYKSGEKKRSLLQSSKLDGIKRFQGYQLSDDENKALLETGSEQIYRHSSRGIYYVYDFSTETLTKLSENKVQEPTFSPDASKVAYVYENNIYIKDLSSGNEVQVTEDGKKNEIINGITDWVYEEEFGIVRAFEWNATGNYLAYLRFDEKEVPEFSMDVFGEELYPEASTFKYPKAGEKNAEVSLHIYSVAEKTSRKVELGNYEDFYIPRINWTNDPAILSVQVLNRHQNNLDLIFVNAKTLETKVVLNEKDKAYVDITDNLTFLKDNSFIWTSEKDGFNHIYHYDETGKLINQVTNGDWEVTRYYGFSPKTNTIFYQSTENGSLNRDVYSIKANGKSKKRLTNKEGTNSADFSTDFTYFINTFTNTSTPYTYTLHEAKTGKLVREIKDNNELLELSKAYDFAPKELSTITVNGNELNMWMIKPTNFDETKKYPLLMFQYSGPGSQSVSNTYYNSNEYWYQLLANEGYIVAAVDGRGTGYKGAAFKKVTQNELGKYELEDQIAAAKLFSDYDYIDEERIGIWGWSYGGFMSTNAILKGNDVFSMAIAVALMTSWRFYDTIYTERYLTTPQENPSGYDENSPLSHVEKLKGDYLLIHGSADDNVHVQNTMRLVEALIQANKQFDWRIYPDKNHGIYGGNTRLHLYTLMTKFIKEKL
ncbi:DPP IV N-terminal domain-containing protein [Antarcticibacterium sp. 1MA-6-2]|uniref:S9 family peptidase n=1 Tax=Antarcticibacterium sp. 1MA-6-2 TaxID=2908210 RepID=UPI001F3B7138|nr:S9 family peptidase [Antarcticibacterium sp. 1MA-6-2]UJH89832.1 DPP IV N-terminal domain-containing protein [Antarcticibacterium sp. 1MA-6-2]